MRGFAHLAVPLNVSMDEVATIDWSHLRASAYSVRHARDGDRSDQPDDRRGGSRRCSESNWSAPSYLCMTVAAARAQRYSAAAISRQLATNLARMRYLLEHDLYDLPNSERPECHRDAHSYKSMYGRLKWAEPAQTITSGFGSIGQGRYMHPTQMRALTAHEAARIQGFPDYFDFSAVTKRSELATMIGNAVPPALMREIAATVLPALVPAEEVPDQRELMPAAS